MQDRSSISSRDAATDKWPQAYFERAPVIFLVLDREARVVHINRTGLNMLARSDEDVVGRPWLEELVPAGDRSRQRELLRPLFDAQEEVTETYEGALLSKTGEEKAIAWTFQKFQDVAQDDTFVFGTGIDVTERKAAELALLDSEAKARAIVETSVDAVITIDDHGIIGSFNPAAERIFGYASEEVVGRNVTVLMPAPYQEEHDGYLNSYLETGRRKIIGIGREVVGRRKDGTTFPMDLAVSEVFLNGRILFTGIVRDITERRRLEQEILRISDEERRRIGQDLHDGLGQMLTGTALIAGDLAKRVRAAGRDGAEGIEEIAELIREADRFARGLAKGLVPVELEEAGLTAALHRLVHNAERLFNVRCVFESVGTADRLDNIVSTHLYRIAQEAVSNSVKHGQARKITVTLASGDHQLRMMVKDDGIGFPATPPEDGGMGVPIMQYRARIIGASFEIWKNPAGGTVVICTLPFETAAVSPISVTEETDYGTDSYRR